MAERPTLITIIGGLTILLAIFMLIIGAALLVIPESTILEIWNEAGSIGDMTFDTFKSAISIGAWTLIIAGIVEFIIGFALLRGWTVAWYLGVIIYAFNAIFSLLTIMSMISILSLVLSIVILYYLFRPNVKEFFGV